MPKDGKDGVDGKSVTLDDVTLLVERAVKALPVPKDGKDGADGAGVAGAMIDRTGALLLTLSNGEVKNLGNVVGKDGASFEDFNLSFDADNHEVVVQAKAGVVAKEVRAPIHGLVMRGEGYWREGTKAKGLEVWSYGGNLWVAKRATSSRPDTQSEDWVLAARKGRDGQGVDRIPVPTGPVRLGA